MRAGEDGNHVIDGRFELLERLGGGGMGLVWRARDLMLHREVALKEVRSPDPSIYGADPSEAFVVRERVLREAQALARLTHPNVVTIYHIVDSRELAHPWLVMELVTGGSLEGRLERGLLAEGEAARIGRGVLGALRAAHAAGIQHRDVKPANVLLRADGTPVLTDFGIAALEATPGLTATGMLIGSPEYMAPERVHGREGDPASDLWSLGLMLYVGLEGLNPLRRDTTIATIAAVAEGHVPPPVRSGAMGPVLSALLVRDPALRPTAEQLDWLLGEVERGADPLAGSMPSASGLGYTTPYEMPGRPTGPNFAGGPGYGTGPNYGPGQNYGSGQNYGPGQTYDTGQNHRSGPVYDTAQNHAPGTVPTGDPNAGTNPVANPYDGRRPKDPGRRTRTASFAVSGLFAVAMSGGIMWFAHHAADTAAKTANRAITNAGADGGTSAGSAGGQPTAERPSATKGAKIPDTLTPEGARQAVRAALKFSGGTKIVKANLYGDYALFDIVKPDDPAAYDTYMVNSDGSVKLWVKGDALDAEVHRLDPLKDINWDAMPGLLKDGNTSLNVKNPTSRFFVVDYDIISYEPRFAVYIGNDYHSGFIDCDLNGKVRKRYPA